MELVRLSYCCNSPLQRRLGSLAMPFAFATQPRKRFSVLPLALVTHHPGDDGDDCDDDDCVCHVSIVPDTLLFVKCVGGCLLVPLQVPLFTC